ncbi:MAG: TolC family protein [Prevotellaceae bacterium]|nr:TolC family protein [Prevotellaceae bacterium]
MSLDEVIEAAKGQSTEALQAKHTFRASYWEFRSYKAEFLPSLVFSGTLPSFIHGIEQVRQNDGTYAFKSSFSNNLRGTMSLEQNVPFTGGTFSISSGLQRYDQYEPDRLYNYTSTPINITYSQSIFGVNQLKWSKKIEPLKYEEAKRRYLKSIEGVAINAIRYFFNLASAQQNLAIAEFNYANNDTLFKIAGGRYGIGTIGENDLLQSELNYMNSRATLNDAKLQLANAKNRLRSFLGFNETADIEIMIPERVPNLDLNLDKIMELAKQSNPDLMAFQRQLIEAEKNVATQKASRFSANIDVEFGLNPRDGGSEQIANAYKNLKDREVVSLGLRIPILDWGRGKGRVKMAQSNQDLVKAQIEQELADFEQNIILQVNQFNQQGEQFAITAKADTIAQNRYAVSKQRYLIDKITITDMNNAQNDRDNARQRYLNALSNYWNYYYTLRQTTLYNLLFDKPLDVDYDMLID